ncbi:hypothetical protein [Synechococcus sp. CCAP 1479/13]|uniref:hypothetical protein n=1 Tax=Synechococcus sp. CCAP 1479/13 TaxID=1221595 RepID=UPI001C22C498|nr:hypothetical protein [Synechococcus sp. CCAP 1479/13]
MSVATAVASRTGKRIVQDLAQAILAVPLTAHGNPVTNRATTMDRFLWHIDPDGWPLECIDTHTGQHVPVVTGRPEELAQAGGSHPIACLYPRVAGVVWGLGGGLCTESSGSKTI